MDGYHWDIVTLCEMRWKNFGEMSTDDGHKSRKENPQKLTQLSSRSHPRHLVGKRTAQKDTIIDITSDNQVNSKFISVEKRTNVSMGLDFLCIRT